jgi:hypothetical protein
MRVFMKWYMTKLVFRINHGKGADAQFDEQLRLIEAGTLADAFLKARMLGEREEDKPEVAGSVRWEFIDVADLYPIDSFQDGMELSSRVHETEEAGSYIRFIRNRASVMEKRIFAEPEKSSGIVI